MAPPVYGAKDKMLELPSPNSTWLHKNGQKYTVICIANAEATRPDYPITVVYKGTDSKIWCQPLSKWFEAMTKETK